MDQSLKSTKTLFLTSVCHYAGTTYLRITIAPTCTKIKNNVAMLAQHIWELPLLLDALELNTTHI